jgi:hypothetical protein
MPRTRTLCLLVAALSLGSALPLGQAVVPNPAPALALPQEGPDVPVASLAPTAVVTVTQDEGWYFTAGVRPRWVDIPASPTGHWDRIILVYRERPVGSEPWDRTFSFYVNGSEVLRGTTPRTDFTVRKDITAWASQFPPGGQAFVGPSTDSWCCGGGQVVTTKLELYADEPTRLLVDQPADHVVAPWYEAGLCENGRLTRTVTFPDAAPSGATVEFYLSGHGHEEFWWLEDASLVHNFHLLVDGHEVAWTTVLPYTYAFIGFYGGEYSLHPLMWWTAQQALDVAGVHTGVGEIPAYRAGILLDDLGWLRGTHTVEVVPEYVEQCVWVTSVNFLLYD